MQNAVEQDAPTPSIISAPASAQAGASKPSEPARVAEIGGPTGPEPTRYGDWERKGRCIDF